MRNKSKSKTNSRAELHFVSSLQLEQAVRVIGSIADERHQVTITEVNPDEFQFHIDYLPEKSKLAEINGKLQRWNGTETKVDADGTIYRIDTANPTYSPTTPGMLFLLCLVIVVMSTLAAGWDGLITSGMVSGGIYTYFAYFKPGDPNQQKVLFRHRDYLLQQLIVRFRSAGDVEAI